jgi:NTE family protein
MAHIGVIQELNRLGFEISAISGTSIGALIGGIYAAGGLESFRNWIVDLDKLDIFRLVDFSMSTSGFIKGDKVFRAIETLIPDLNIQQLSIPFSAIAADINTGEEVVLQEGSLYQALKASCAVPTVLQPRLVNNRELVDGGVINPIPVTHVKRNPGDLLVVVNLNAKIPYKAPTKKSSVQLRNDQIYLRGLEAFRLRWQQVFHSKPEKPHNRKFGYFELMSRSFDLVQDELCAHILESSQPDIVVEISRTACETFDFHRADEMIAEGRRALNHSLAWKMIRDNNFRI